VADVLFALVVFAGLWATLCASVVGLVGYVYLRLMGVDTDLLVLVCAGVWLWAFTRALAEDLA
jgi:hypothetical protein